MDGTTPPPNSINPQVDRLDHVLLGLTTIERIFGLKVAGIRGQKLGVL